MPKHTHHFVETYDGLVGFGLDRETDEKTLVYYLQKFSDDRLLERLVPKLSDPELEELFAHISRILRTRLSKTEYHRLFLKEDPAE